MLTKTLAALATSMLLVGATAHVADATASAHHYPNCTALNHVYPHGVGRYGAHDHVSSGQPVTNFKRSNRIYNANTGRDRDGDHIACEKH